MLVGELDGGFITRCSVSGSITAEEDQHESAVGAMAGLSAGTISYSSAAASVSSSSDLYIGGLVGWNIGTIILSSASGTVSGGLDGADFFVGGLAGENAGLIDQSNSSSNVTVPSGLQFGLSAGGGLVGWLAGTVSNSRAMGTVTGTGSYVFIGGLAGFFQGSLLETSYASGAVSGPDRSEVGGLVGHAAGAVISSYSSGNVKAGASKVGGLIGGLGYTTFGQAPGSVKTSFSTGSVTSGDQANTGGLIGYKDQPASVMQAYSIGLIIAGTGGATGGLIGSNEFTNKPNVHLKATDWDLDTSGIDDPAQGVGNIPNAQGVIGLTDGQLKSALPDGFDPQVWGQSSDINNGYPYLLANPPPQNAPGRTRRKSLAHFAVKMSMRAEVARH